MNKIKVASICVHNSCRSQMAEALGKKYLSDICDCYSAGSEVKPQINQDAVRLMKQVHGIDMEESQYSKLFEEIPEADIVVSMGCNVICPYIPGKENHNWGLEDPTGQSDEKFLEVMGQIEKNIKDLRWKLLLPKACREVILFLDVMPRRYTRKIPWDIYLKIRDSQDLEYHPQCEGKLNWKSDANNIDFLRETLVIISWLNLELWETSEEEKERLRAVYAENDLNCL